MLSQTFHNVRPSGFRRRTSTSRCTIHGCGSRDSLWLYGFTSYPSVHATDGNHLIDPFGIGRFLEIPNREV